MPLAAGADRANEMLDPDTWDSPPWDATRWAALAGVLEMAEKD